jgi:hypothetical protein
VCHEVIYRFWLTLLFLSDPRRDVGAMYPNIILTNRLQPSAIVDDATCAACDYNQAKNDCKRKMEWVWRGDYNPASKSDYDRTREQLSREIVQDGMLFNQLPEKEQATIVSKRLKEYSRNVYKKTKVTEEITREDVVCMRENDFYVDTVRQFRDRRYEYKSANKTWKKKVASAKDAATKKFCEDKVLVYDSLQVAHKCILNRCVCPLSSLVLSMNHLLTCIFSFPVSMATLCAKERDGVQWKWLESLPRLVQILSHRREFLLNRSADLLN